MAAIVQNGGTTAREERFFFTIACVMAAVIVAGFSFNLAMGRSSFSLPLIDHIHAFVFFSWVALYVVQNALISRDLVAIHRKLGWLSIGYVPVMVGLGIAVVLNSLARGGPPFFAQNEFLFGNIAGLITFAGLIVAALVMRRRTDWHRRLMLSGMAILTGPGFGRLLPVPLLIPWAWQVSNAVPMIFVLTGIIFDLRRNGRPHPAWIAALAAVFTMQVISNLIAFSPFGISVTEHVIAGTPGARRGMAAFFPG